MNTLPPMKAYAVVWLPCPYVTQYIAARSRPKATARAFQEVRDAYLAPSWNFRTVRAPEYDGVAATVEQVQTWAAPIGWKDLQQAWGCAAKE